MTVQRRRFLVVVRAGDASLHPGWIDAARSRTFDLVVSYYGSDPARYRDSPFERIDDPGQKYVGAQRLFRRDRFWLDYDYVWLPDDDLATEQDEIDEMFARMDAMGLDLGHPALEWHSHYFHVVMVRSPSLSARFTDFVELMGPVFSRRFLERCLPTFDANLSGWGLSFIWPRMLGPGLQRCAIIDDATVTHTRPFGGPTYDLLRKLGRDPYDEFRELMQQHGLPVDTPPNIYGAVVADGQALDLKNLSDQDLYGRIRQHDIAEFARARRTIETTSALGRRPSTAARPRLPLEALRAAAAQLRFVPTPPR